MKIRTDDNVIVISGKDKGRTGKVIRTEPKRERVYVEGVNMVKRHQRQTAEAPAPTPTKRHPSAPRTSRGLPPASAPVGARFPAT